MMANPYSWNEVNIDLFFGRQDLRSELIARLTGTPRYSFGISGARRMGKSTLLRRVEADLLAGADQWREGGLLVLPVYIDGQALNRPLTPNAIWTYLLGELVSSLPVDPLDVPATVDFGVFKSFLAPLLESVTLGVRVIVMFDEIEPLLAADPELGFLANWRALLSNTPGLSSYFTAIFSGAQEMVALQLDLGSPLKDILEWRGLRSLDYESACELMIRPSELELSDSFLHRAYAETGGHPMLLQFLMLQVLDNSDPSDYGLDNAISLCEQSRRWQFQEWWTRYCTPSAQRVYAKMPDDGLTIPLRAITLEFGSDEASSALDVLLHTGLVSAEDDGFAYRYAMDLFRRWFRRHASLSPQASHDILIYQSLQEIDQGIADKYRSAWSIFEADLSDYSGAAATIRETLTLLLDILAPEQLVMAEPDFVDENHVGYPTRRQRVRFAARQRLMMDTDSIRELSGDFELLDADCEQLAAIATLAYKSTSGLVHSVAARDQAYQALKQWDAILSRILRPIR